MIVPNEELIVSLPVGCLDPLVKCRAEELALTQRLLRLIFSVLLSFEFVPPNAPPPSWLMDLCCCWWMKNVREHIVP